MLSSKCVQCNEIVLITLFVPRNFHVDMTGGSDRAHPSEILSINCHYTISFNFR
jgi:hypothetical protein